MIQFYPKLPAKKIKALSKQVLACYVKVFVKWELRWWGKFQTNLHTMLVEEGEENQRWRMISEVSHSKADDEESKMLCFTAAGQEAKRVHKLTDE